MSVLIPYSTGPHSTAMLCEALRLDLKPILVFASTSSKDTHEKMTLIDEILVNLGLSQCLPGYKFPMRPNRVFLACDPMLACPKDMLLWLQCELLLLAKLTKINKIWWSSEAPLSALKRIQNKQESKLSPTFTTINTKHCFDMIAGWVDDQTINNPDQSPLHAIWNCITVSDWHNTVNAVMGGDIFDDYNDHDEIDVAPFSTRVCGKCKKCRKWWSLWAEYYSQDGPP